ncbi:DNA cytosine methyltransferase [Spirulina sp. CS-785/01]|uniref:DNA cytosine methyltransferase n=1 Tax=Spirulina sp. CS-785/01 TaxID=3021716 RepID=UPI00232EEC26|nr:DNA cytosine methyltransferase [Spirulina sp. CS-785/01]MDB9315864.1 DNA cytosine methyltransferase [Spirulina sp. CS-785/01]
MPTYHSNQLQLPLKVVSTVHRFSFVDLFAGIGGFRIALEKLGGKCRAYSEIDKEAIKVYQQNFINYLTQDEPSLGDITQVEAFPDNIDLVVGGVPCQPWSVAGQLKGFADPRGKLWFDVVRLIKQSQPKAFIFENVRGLANPKNRDSFEFLLQQFTTIGYQVKWNILNAYDFGLPQNRERVFIVGIRQDIANAEEYEFPSPLNLNPKVLDILDEFKNHQLPQKAKLDPDVIFKNNNIPPSRTRFQKSNELNDFFIFSDLRNGHTTIHSWDILETTAREKEICLTLLKNRRRKKYGKKDGNPLALEHFQEFIPDLCPSELEELVNKNIFRKTDNNKYEFVNSKNMSGINGVYRIILPNCDVVPTLTATGSKNFYATCFLNADNPEDYKKKFLKRIYKQQKYKPFTAQHACKLQGFPEDFVLHSHDKTAQKQFGNAVPVPVVFHVAKHLMKIILNCSDNSNAQRSFVGLRYASPNLLS